MTDDHSPLFPNRSGNEFQDLCTMIGLMAVSWAWAETALALTNDIINKRAGPISGHPQDPLSLKRRIRFLRTALRDVAALQPVQEEGRLLAERFVKLGMRRHEFVHSATWQVHQGRFEGISIGVEAGKYAAKNHSFDVSGAISLNIEIGQLSDDATAFSLKVDSILIRK